MLRPAPIGPVPDDTIHVTHAAFPKGHPYLILADELGTAGALHHDGGAGAPAGAESIDQGEGGSA